MGYKNGSETEGFVYFVLDKPYFARGEWRIKIGFSVNLNTRIREAYGKHGILLGVAYGVYTDEASIHDLFRFTKVWGSTGGRKKSDWFFLDDALFDFIQDVAQLPEKASLPMMEAKFAKSLAAGSAVEQTIAFKYGLIQSKIAALHEEIAALELIADKLLAEQQKVRRAQEEKAS
jgi:hypothetical protein